MGARVEMQINGTEENPETDLTCTRRGSWDIAHIGFLDLGADHMCMFSLGTLNKQGTCDLYMACKSIILQ